MMDNQSAINVTKFLIHCQRGFFPSKDVIFICIFVFTRVEVLLLLSRVFLTIFVVTNMALREYEPTDPPYNHLLRLKWPTYHV